MNPRFYLSNSYLPSAFATCAKLLRQLLGVVTPFATQNAGATSRCDSVTPTTPLHCVQGVVSTASSNPNSEIEKIR